MIEIFVFVCILILGIGNMVNFYVKVFVRIDGVEIVVGVDCWFDVFWVFCNEFNVLQGFDSLELVIDWGGFDVVVNVIFDVVYYVMIL